MSAPSSAVPLPTPLASVLPLYTQAMRVRSFAPSTIETQTMLTRWFLTFAAERGVQDVTVVTRELVERYQRHLYTVRITTGAPTRHGEPAVAALRPLSIRGQHARLWAVVRFFRWAVRTGQVEHSPAAALELPRLPHPLPKPALTVAEVERILALPNLTTPQGLRDRALLEVLYATGMRRGEVIALQLDALDRDRGVVRIESGKGRKGRIVPISVRAMCWLDRYLSEVWPCFPQAFAHRRIFISVADARRRFHGRPLGAATVTRILGAYVAASGVTKAGACHIFRHTAATLMMENGADIRAIQDLLGHSDLKTTGIYTNVSLKFLKEQHTRTHPSAFAAEPAVVTSLSPLSPLPPQPPR